MIEVVAASPAHVGRIASRMRAIDAAECAAFGRSPKQALRAGLQGSVASWTALVDGRPEAMFGVAPASMIDGRGRPWLLGTDVVPLAGPALMRLGRRHLAAMHRLFPRLENMVSARNEAAVRWLAHLGFEFGDEAVIGGETMREFWRDV